MSTLVRQIAFSRLDQLQTELVNAYDGWPNVPTEIRGSVEELRILLTNCLLPDPTTATQAANRAMAQLITLPSEALRVEARKIITRRIKHPEGGLDPQPPVEIHPRATGRNYSTQVAAPAEKNRCAVCRRHVDDHDIDGLNDQCDGYVSES